MGDLDVSKSERRRRAEGVRIIGEIYRSVGIDALEKMREEENRRYKEEEEKTSSAGQSESAQHGSSEASDEQAKH